LQAGLTLWRTSDLAVAASIVPSAYKEFILGGGLDIAPCHKTKFCVKKVSGGIEIARVSMSVEKCFEQVCSSSIDISSCHDNSILY